MLVLVAPSVKYDLSNTNVKDSLIVISFLQSIWRQTTRIAWSLYPAVAVHLPERFKVDSVSHEVTRLIRSDPGLVVDVPDALAIFVGDNVTPEVRRQLRVRFRTTTMHTPLLIDSLCFDSTAPPVLGASSCDFSPAIPLPQIWQRSHITSVRSTSP